MPSELTQVGSLSDETGTREARLTADPTALPPRRPLWRRALLVVGAPLLASTAVVTVLVVFCQTSFDVTFPMSSKLEVNGSSRHPLYNFLTSPDTGVSGEITWNFEKFLIGRDGKVLKRYPPQTKPQDSAVMQDIADAL